MDRVKEFPVITDEQREEMMNVVKRIEDPTGRSIVSIEDSPFKNNAEKSTLAEIESKIDELARLVEYIPDECKGNFSTASFNRRRFIHIRAAIHNLQDDLRKMK